jgi:hypothetical protein
MAQQFGDLLLQFTSDFSFAYNDRGSGGRRDGGFWYPKPGPGFSILGGYGQGNYDDPNGKQWALCVAEATPGGGARPALHNPVDWVQVWADHGSGGDQDGSAWRPIPPQGYFALGDVFVDGYDKPRLDLVMCVRDDLTFPGKIAGQIWNDSGSGADADVGVWAIDAPDGVADQYGFIAVNTFLAVPNYDTPVSDPSANVLKLPFPVSAADAPEPPVLGDKKKPDDQTTPFRDHTVMVPFTGITDQQQTMDWQIRNSPFYTLERYVYYSLLLFNDNRTEKDQITSSSVTVGVTETKSKEFSVETSITVGFEAGVALISGKVSASVTVKLGYKQSTSVAVMQSSTVRGDLLTPSRHAAALWAAGYQLQLARADGTRVGLPLQFDSASSSFLESQFPAPTNAEAIHLATTFAG